MPSKHSPRIGSKRKEQEKQKKPGSQQAGLVKHAKRPLDASQGSDQGKTSNSGAPLAQRRKLDHDEQAESAITPDRAPTSRNTARDPQPPAPAAVLPKDDITHLHLTRLASAYTTAGMIVTKNCKITTKVTQLLDRTGRFDIVAVSGRAEASNKLVSVVEIAKREMAGSGRGFFQYTACGSRMEVWVERERGGKTGGGTGSYGRKMEVVRDGNGTVMSAETIKDVAVREANEFGVGVDEVEEEEEDDDDDDDEKGVAAFETLRPVLRDKVRRVPIMTVFLCAKQIPELARLYKEQSSVKKMKKPV